MTSPIINLSALEPLYQPHKMPEFHRIRAKREGEPAEIVKGRRPGELIMAHQDKELTDIKITKEGLAHWVHGLCKIYFAHH